VAVFFRPKSWTDWVVAACVVERGPGGGRRRRQVNEGGQRGCGCELVELLEMRQVFDGPLPRHLLKARRWCGERSTKCPRL